MRSLDRIFQFNEEGKGSVGCMLSLVVMAIVLFIAFKAGPPYYNNYNLEGELKSTVSRMSARSLKEEFVIKNLIHIAENYNIVLTKKNIKIGRFGGKLYIEIDYTVPIDFLILQRELHFKMREESFTIS